MGQCINSIKKALLCKSTLFIDLISDTVRIRFILPLMCIIILYKINSSFFGIDFGTFLRPISIHILRSFSDIINLGEMANISRSSIVRVVDQFGNSIEGINISVVLINLEYKGGNYYYDSQCDWQYLSIIRGTYTFYRASRICQIDILENSQKTDINGIAKFDKFLVRNSPIGMYSFNYNVSGYFKSSIFTVLVRSKVSEMNILNLPPKFANIGVKLSIQPMALILDQNGNPLSNVTITAISYPYSSPNSYYNLLNDADDNKFAILNNDISRPSNSSGIASFENLTIEASTHKTVYILFIINGGFIYKSWAPPLLRIYSKAIPGQNFYPINIRYDEKISISIINTFSSSIIEGVSFEIPPILQLRNQFNFPSSNISCFALIDQFNNMIFPAHSPLSNPLSSSKELIFPFTANFKNCSFTNFNCFILAKSNEMGLIGFTNLSFSISGNLFQKNGNAFIHFSCGNGFTEQISIQINSSISAVKISGIPSFIQVGLYLRDNSEFILSFKLQNTKLEPIFSKAVEKIEVN